MISGHDFRRLYTSIQNRLKITEPLTNPPPWLHFCAIYRWLFTPVNVSCHSSWDYCSQCHWPRCVRWWAGNHSASDVNVSGGQSTQLGHGETLAFWILFLNPSLFFLISNYIGASANVSRSAWEKVHAAWEKVHGLKFEFELRNGYQILTSSCRLVSKRWWSTFRQHLLTYQKFQIFRISF